MKERVKIFSYIILLANIVLLAHSFIPHEHNNFTHPEEIAVSCSCTSCSAGELRSADQDDENCGCCSGGGKGCFISNGYLGHHAEDINDNVLLYNIVEIFPINLFQVVSIEDSHYTDFTSPLLDGIMPWGLGMRAPPVLFS